MAETEDRGANQQARYQRGNPQNGPSTDLLQNSGPDESPNHGPAPVVRHVLGGRQLRDIADVGLAEVVDEITSDGNLRAHIDEDSNRTQHQLRMPPYALTRNLSMTLSARQRRQLEHGDSNRQRHQCEPDDKVGQLHRRRFVDPVGLMDCSRHLPYDIGTLPRAAEDDRAAQPGSNG